MKQKMILIVSIVIGLLAALLTRSYLNAKDREIENRLNEINRRDRKVEVLVPTADLPAGSVLKMEDLGMLTLPERGLRSDVIDPKAAMSLVGSRIIYSVSKGKPLLWSDIEGGDPARGGLASDIKTRMRAVSINVSGAASVSGMVKPNDHIDVLGTFTFPNAKNGELELVTLTILQNVTVLATGKDRTKSGQANPNASYNTVTLEVTPREAEMLAFAEQIKGRLTIALRNPADLYYEKTLPKVDFSKIQTEIESLNQLRQETVNKVRP